jgi:hypothetical protein
VAVTGLDGVTHSIDVQASSLFERFLNALAAYHLVAANHQNGAGLIEGSQRVDIAEIKSLLEESMDFGRAICWHRLS